MDKVIIRLELEKNDDVNTSKNKNSSARSLLSDFVKRLPKKREYLRAYPGYAIPLKISQHLLQDLSEEANSNFNINQ